jgi:hypothetical protein
MQIKSLLKKGLTFTIVVLFIGASTATMVEPSITPMIITKATVRFHGTSRDQIELKYYNPDKLSQVIGIQNAPVVWKTAIRFTQTELALYNTLNITQVIIGFDENPNEGPMTVRIYIYGEGTPSNPGTIIVNDTTATLTGTALITVHLTTPVSLTGHNEVWVAVEWTQHNPTSYYVIADKGPAVTGKGDWLYRNNEWSELPAEINANWALGAVVESNNHPPSQPVITGPSRGKAGTSYTYYFTAADPDGNNVFYFIDWYDGSTSGWLGPYPSGEEIDASHVWNNKGDYFIKVKAKDIFGVESGWANLLIHMPLSYEQPHFRFFDWLFKQFPYAFSIFRYLFGVVQ